MKKNEQPGLRLRLAHEARRIASQHSYLDAMKATTMRALERGEALEIRQALRGFRGSLEAHFELEEQLHFPALHGLHPEFAPDLTALVAEHERFRAGLGRLEEGAGQGPPNLTELAAAFRDLAAELARHEEREEGLLARAPRQP